MTRTLADMTPAERADCVGRWAERKRHLMVITAVSESARTADWCCPATASSGWDGWAELTPRFDLPRAWAPTGEPADMDVETGRVEYGRIWCGSEIMERTNLPDGTTVHRHVTDWEEA